MFCNSRKSTSSASFWLLPPEPAILLASQHFELSLYHCPRVYFWLPHFLVKLRCPYCKSKLEKNGALLPRRVTDISDNFYIIGWAYYCHNGCRKHVTGWNQALIESLPRYLRHSFPAILSHKGGLSNEVMGVLRVGNQHKMGLSGVHALLVELHTTRFSKLQVQYLKAIFEVVNSHESIDKTSQETLHHFLMSCFPGFGDFGMPEQYSGFVPSKCFLAKMMNKAIEADEADANQHIACLPPDQIAIDDSHKVGHQLTIHLNIPVDFDDLKVNKHIEKIDGIPIFGALWTCMDSKYIHGQALTLTKLHKECIGPLMGIAKSLQLYGHPNPPIASLDNPVKVSLTAL